MEKKASCAKEFIKVSILLDENRSFQIGASMPNKDKVEMLLLLVQNVDVFAWSPYEVLGVDLEFIVHRLNVDLLYPHKKKKLKRSAKEHVEAIKQEVKMAERGKGNK